MAVRKGAAGRRRYGFSSDVLTLNAASCEALRQPASSRLVETDEVVLAEGRIGGEVATLRDAPSVDGHEPGIERAGVEAGRDIPVVGRDEGDPLALALDDESRGDGLNPSRGEPARDLLPQNRRDLIAIQPIEDAPGFLRVDQALVDHAGVLERSPDRLARDLVKDHAADGHLRLQHLDEVPRDRLTLAVLVRREQELVGVLQVLLQLGDDLLLLGIDDVVRLEFLVDVDAEGAEPLALGCGYVGRAIGKIANVPDARLDGEVLPEVARDRPRLGGALHDDQPLTHRRAP